MIYNVKGNLLEQEDVNIICHQTNCKGVMGGGIALQIRKKYPEVFKEYVDYCEKYGDQALGTVLFATGNDGKVIANLFGQNGFGSWKCQTDYEALERAVATVAEVAHKQYKSVGFPYMIGCGLAGGDWEIVNQIIEKYFGDSDVSCYVCRLQ